jgi:NAD(P)-dependent dehydrogenase (short-subunit alcohol dehydrogenase family)
MNPTYDFSGQVALVTGAGAGMGLDTARAFAATGAQSCSPMSTSRRCAPRRTS